MSELKRQIREEIRLQGIISFARFMELALYCPVYGFYEREADTVGRSGHFYTSVSVGPLFGEMLGFHFASLVAENEGQGSVCWVEAGAHDGKLAKDILSWLKTRQPALYERLVYIIVEPSDRRRQWQARALEGHLPRIRWVPDLSSMPTQHGGITILFCNELLDAFPVHRLRWSPASGWLEIGVALTGDEFGWAPMGQLGPSLSTALPPVPNDITLPDGYEIEVSPAAIQWWKTAAGRLSLPCRLFALDYGLTVEDRFLPERVGGTLRAYRHHAVSREVLADPGEQDITAHVDFASLQRAGETAGLKTVTLSSQGRFLSQVGAGMLEAGCRWDAARVRQFHTLTHPQHLGHPFKVLIQRS